jgi:hypothetical protein
MSLGGINTLKPYSRIGGYTLNKEKYEKPEISTEVLEPYALCRPVFSGAKANDDSFHLIETV